MARARPKSRARPESRAEARTTAKAKVWGLLFLKFWSATAVGQGLGLWL